MQGKIYLKIWVKNSESEAKLKILLPQKGVL